MSPANVIDLLMRELRARQMLATIERVAVDYGVETRDILQYSRDPGTEVARRAAWAAIAEAFPSLTTTELAKLLNRQQAQTIVDGIARHKVDVERAHTPVPGKKLPLMLPGAGVRRDCMNDGDCLTEVGIAYPAANTAHCPDPCPKFEPPPRHALHAMASVKRNGVF